MIHALKRWKVYFQLMVRGVKTFELRKNDRAFLTGQELLLKEYDRDKESLGLALSNIKAMAF